MKKRLVSRMLAMAVMLIMVFTLTAGSAAKVGGTARGVAQGFGGEVSVVLSVVDGKIVSVKMEGPGETEGLGSVILAEWPDAFVEANGLVDTYSGATFASVTRGAVMEAAKDALKKLGLNPAEYTGEAGAAAEDAVSAEETGSAEAEPAAAEEEPVDPDLTDRTGLTGFVPGTYAATGTGYSENTPVKVKITVDENAVITAAQITGAEEIPFGMAYFETYEQALIGRTDGEIDAASQATMTRNGVAEAVAKALAEAKGETGEQAPEEAPAAAEETMPEKTEEEPAAEEPAAWDLTDRTGQTGFVPGTYEGTGKGYSENTPVTVKITVDENAVITSAKIEGPEEVPFGMAYFETYEQALIGRTDGEIDAASQATMTRNGVAEAVAKALAEAKGETGEEAPAEAPAAEETMPEEPAAEEPAAEEPAASGQTGQTGIVPGTYEGTGKGYSENTPVTVKITVDENAVITSAKIEGPEEVPFGMANFETYEQALIGRTDGEIDAVSQATMTRNGVAEAVGKALAEARGEDSAAESK